MGFISMFNKFVPKASKVIGNVSNIGRNIGQIVHNARSIGSVANQLSGGRLSSNPIAQKIEDAANKIEAGANFVSNNEGQAQNALATLSRKINA